MHVIDRSHLPRFLAVTIAAAIIAILITLVLAAGVGDLTQHTSYAAKPDAPTAPGVLNATAKTVGHPLMRLLSGPLAQPWFAERP